MMESHFELRTEVKKIEDTWERLLELRDELISNNTVDLDWELEGETREIFIDEMEDAMVIAIK